MFDTLIDWLSQDNRGWAIAYTLVIAFLVRHFGDMLLEKILRRTVRHRAHGDMNDEDIKKRQNTLISVFSAIMHVLVWLVTLFTLIGLLFPTINLAPILAGASVLGVALGFGAQTVIKDFLTGMLIILENQYRVGDIVEIDTATGTVEQITIRSTVLRDTNGAVHYIPNGTIAHVINKTMGFAKINLSIAVVASTDIDKAAALINECGELMAAEEKWKAKLIEPPHYLSIGTFTDEALELKVIGKTQPAGQWAVTAELRKRLFAAFKKQKIELASLPTSGSVSIEAEGKSKK